LAYKSAAAGRLGLPDSEGGRHVYVAGHYQGKGITSALPSTNGLSARQRAQPLVLNSVISPAAINSIWTEFADKVRGSAQCVVMPPTLNGNSHFADKVRGALFEK
jgi:hypothetical protein